MYKSYVLPIFDYGDIIWGDQRNSEVMEKLERFQECFTKKILKLDPTIIVDNLRLLPLEKRFFHRCLYVFKYCHNISSTELLPNRGECVAYSIRNPDKISLP